MTIKQAFCAISAYCLFLSATDARAQETAGQELALVPAKIAAWWFEGDTVKYRLSSRQLPEGTKAVQGTITDVSGNNIATIEVKAADLATKGWEWQPTAPGFYEVEFSYSKEGESKKLPVVVRRDMKAPGNIVKTFERKKQGFAVMPKRPVPETPVGQFGFTYGGHSEEIALARMIGLDLLRIHLWWGPEFSQVNGGIEKVKGTYEWEPYDALVDLFANNGFVVNLQFISTPLWASPHPDKKDVKICMIEGATYAPTDMDDFTRFVETAVARYKDRVSLWEIWNEPSVPGGSVFWADTTENYVKLLIAGSKAVKKVQPEAEVWIGGIGPRSPYHAFYNRVLKLGGAQYFDVLSLHGAWNTPAEVFRSIEESQGIPPKPAVMGEWHAILQGNMQTQPIMAERALSYRMIKDLLYQIKQGVTRTMLFELVNLTEKESLDYAREHKMFTHSAGLFRRKPQLEPRHAAIVMANFTGITGRKATFGREFDMGEDIISLGLVTNNGPLIAFWSESAPIDAKTLKPFLTSGSSLQDWEGKPVSLKDTEELEKATVYYLTKPNEGTLAKADAANKLISPRNQTRKDVASLKGSFVPGKLFDQPSTVAQVPDQAWIQEGWKLTKLIESAQSDNFKVRAAIGAHEDGLDIVAEVTDPSHEQKESGNWWQADSLQIAADCENTGVPGGNTEVIAALTQQGPVLWKILAANPQGDIPSNWSAGGNLVKYGESHITRDGQITRYQVRIPWSELYPLTYSPTMKLRLALAVNDNNGTGRAAHLDWGAGITGDKDPSLYGELTPVKK